MLCKSVHGNWVKEKIDYVDTENDLNLEEYNHITLLAASK